ncbi:MAG: class I SAM-dependent methyltransferase [Planctomycetota bacterium]
MMNAIRIVLRKMRTAITKPSSIARFLRYAHHIHIAVETKDPEVFRISRWTYGDLNRVPVTELFDGIEDVDVTLIRAYDRELGTSVDLQEILVLSAIVRVTNPKRILEIGTYDGNTALNLAANSPADALITTVDLPPDWDGNLGLAVPDPLVNVTDRTKTGSQFRNTVHANKITQVFCDSAKMDWSKLPVPFDMVLIDGCHYYDYVKTDTQNAMKHLKEDGILIWHDYGMMEDVSRAVDETAREIEVKPIQGTRLAVGFMGRAPISRGG